MKAQRVSEYDRNTQCEHVEGTVQCDRPAAAWTTPNGSGYVEGCSKHAQGLLDGAVAAGDIHPVTGEPES